MQEHVKDRQLRDALRFGKNHGSNLMDEVRMKGRESRKAKTGDRIVDMVSRSIRLETSRPGPNKRRVY